jgi:hypothetical protein
MNRRQTSILAWAIVLSLALGSVIGGAAQPLWRTFLPTIATAQQPSIVTLVDSDTTFVSAERDASTGRIYVAYIDRAHGNKAHFTELIGDQLHEVPLPQLPARAVAPSFSPDSPKDADSAIVAFDGWVYWFVSSREVDMPGAAFKLRLWRFRP